MNKVKIDIDPMGAVRTTQRAKFKDPAALRYGSYKQFIALNLRKVFRAATKQPVDVTVLFIMPIPQSWSKKRQAAAVGMYHTSKPDLDNLIKGCFDAANTIVWQDDNQVVKCNAMKIYGTHAGIEIQVTALYEEVG